MERFNYTQPINIESNLNNIINGEYDNIYSEYKLLHNITLTDKPINNICILINELLYDNDFIRSLSIHFNERYSDLILYYLSHEKKKVNFYLEKRNIGSFY